MPPTTWKLTVEGDEPVVRTGLSNAEARTALSALMRGSALPAAKAAPAPAAEQAPAPERAEPRELIAA